MLVDNSPRSVDNFVVGRVMHTLSTGSRLSFHNGHLRFVNVVNWAFGSVVMNFTKLQSRNFTIVNKVVDNFRKCYWAGEYLWRRGALG